MLFNRIVNGVLIYELIFQLLNAQTVTVARNGRSYCKQLENRISRPNNSTGMHNKFHILQCQNQSITKIPKPKHMPPICTFVAAYNLCVEEGNSNFEGPHKVYRNTRSHMERRAASVLVPSIHTKKFTPRIKRKMVKEFDFKHKNRVATTPKTTVQQRAGTSKLLLHHMNSSDSETFSANSGHDMSNGIDSHLPDNTSEMQTDNVPPKYLNVKDIIQEYLQHEPVQANANSSSELFFKAHNNHRKGNKLQGYQHMYHRDEIYTDHIFYDELEQQGSYKTHKKSQQRL